MDTGGLNWLVIDVVGAAILGLIILYAVMRTKSRGKRDSNPTTERATRELYEAEDRAHRNEDV